MSHPAPCRSFFPTGGILRRESGEACCTPQFLHLDDYGTHRSAVDWCCLWLEDTRVPTACHSPEPNPLIKA